ncbi:C-terminal binding protein [Bifidobacterium subtile]|uniref:Hydroxyacid dehydrogenase n=1 Tax=Bifidobacterium subtile TaxID=77635 RepID=A0A087EA82_9BIFI|nr:C-terminal binding protein [Bifidobacterium subtile]KFJ04683.1 hydroxyacid dehydrogenase [Bifidobacterium subtile]QOL35773.1 C-terminal binding protein [Bifidobacterium subtile]
MNNVICPNLGLDLAFERELLVQWGIDDINLIEINDSRPLDAHVNEYQAAGALLTYEPATADVLARCPSLRIISLESIGYDTVDIAAATAHGVQVTNVPGYCLEDVALHTLAMALDLTRQITFQDRQVRERQWDALSGYPMRRIGGLVFGLVFFGGIAMRLADMLRPLGFDVLVYAPHASDELLAEHGCRRADALDALLAESDYVSLHCPLIAGVTDNLIGAREFDIMKDSAFLINTARGGVINQQALVEALRRHVIRAAALDVVEGEGAGAGELAEIDNCILTPHSAFLSEDSFNELRERALKHIVQALSKYSDGHVDDLVS